MYIKYVVCVVGTSLPMSLQLYSYIHTCTYTCIYIDKVDNELTLKMSQSMVYVLIRMSRELWGSDVMRQSHTMYLCTCI